MLSRKRKIKVGIVTNEYWGFGWAARRAAEVLNNNPRQGFEAVFLTSMPNPGLGRAAVITNGTRLLFGSGRKYKDILRLVSERIDILLTIDYRTDYNGIFDCLPTIPIIIWVRDPGTPADMDKMMSLRFPNNQSSELPGLYNTNTKELANYARSSKIFNRRVILANKMPYLSFKNQSAYGLPRSGHVLPNPDIINYKAFRPKPSVHPRVLFMGSLDPIKRPWLFIELARHFTGVEFMMLGQDQFEGKGGWWPDSIPDNVRILGHVSEEEKHELCSSAWVLVNTSIHEESPVSVFEALASETPVLTYEDWGGIVKNFGITIGQHSGTGFDGIPLLVHGLSQLLSDHERRQALGKAGHQYVKSEHNDHRFLACFRKICRAAGIKPPAGKIVFDIKTGYDAPKRIIRTISEEI